MTRAATTPAGSSQLASRGQVDSPLSDIRNHLGCMRDAHLPVQVVKAADDMYQQVNNLTR